METISKPTSRSLKAARLLSSCTLALAAYLSLPCRACQRLDDEANLLTTQDRRACVEFGYNEMLAVKERVHRKCTRRTMKRRCSRCTENVLHIIIMLKHN